MRRLGSEARISEIALFYDIMFFLYLYRDVSNNYCLFRTIFSIHLLININKKLQSTNPQWRNRLAHGTYKTVNL